MKNAGWSYSLDLEKARAEMKKDIDSLHQISSLQNKHSKMSVGFNI
jgi:hypothetical protein